MKGKPVVVILLDKRVLIGEEGTVTHFSVTATGDIVTPSKEKALKVLGFFFYSSADITVELRFKTSGNVIAGIVAAGACAMNLVGMKKPEGGADEVIEIYLSGAGTVKGWISRKEI